MEIQNLHIVQFRNHLDLKLRFHSQIIAIVGKNGTGKTSILDAIWFVCTGKSNFTSLDQNLIQKGNDYFNLSGIIQKEGENSEIFCAFQIGKRKNIKLDTVPYKKLSEHFGKFPILFIAPKDFELIHDGSEIRRGLMDNAISYLEKEYFLKLLKYNDIVQQRNAELKRLNETETFKESELLGVYNQQLIPLNEYISSKREVFILEIQPIFQEIYQKISGGIEIVSIEYESKIKDSEILQLYNETLKKDIILQRTSIGIHKDDIDFSIHEIQAKKSASQGQIKSIVIAFKLSIEQIIKMKKGIFPLLLLDDICDRLDESRLKSLFELLMELKVDQIFITDTSKQRLETLLPKNRDVQWIEL